MAYSDSFPATRPVFQADFANGGRVDPRITFSRSDTPPTYAAPSAVHYWSNEKHLSSENLFKYSNDLGTGWVEDNLTFTSGQTAPDGGSDAYKVTENSANNEHRSYPTAAISTNGGPTTLSGHFKYIGRQWILFRLNDGSAYRRVWFDIQNGVLGTADTGITASITASGNGFYKCVATIATSNTSYLPVFGGAAANTSIVYTGSGADAFYVWGLQYNHNVGSVLNETSGQIHRAYAPTLKSVSTAGQPRFEHSPTDSASAAMGESLGLLIEGQSTNLLAGSATIGGTYWGVVNATSQQNSAVAPDGTLTAATLVENSAGGAKYAYTNNFTPAASTTYTFSAFVKPNGRNFCMIYTGLGGVNQSSMFDLITGATSNLSGSGVNTATQCGNGWWRLSVTVTTTSTTTANFQILPATDATTFDYTGNGYSGLICWGAMLEQSSFASSYIGTTSSAVTRAADSASTPIASTGYSGNNGTMLVEVDGGYGANPCAVALHDGAGYERAMIMRDSSTANDSTDFLAFVGDKSGTSSTLNLSGSGSASKVAVSFATNDFAATAGGGTVVTSTSGVSPAAHLTTLQIGAQIANNPWNGHIKRVALYSEALSDSNLISLTK